MSEGLPDGWAEATVGALCNLVNGRAFKPQDWTETGLPIVRIQNLNRPDAPFNRYDGEVADKFLIGPGELLFAWSGTPGTSFGAHVWNGGPAVLNQHIFKVEFNQDAIDKRFFMAAINQTLESLIDQAHGGVGLRHVTKGVFEATPIPVPPLAEQRRIVAKLDRLSARSSAARRHLARVAALAARAKQAILAAAFNGDLTADWRRTSLEAVVADGLIGLVRSKTEQSDEGAPYIRMNHFDLSGSWNADNLTRVAVTDGELARFELRAGDVLFNTRNSVELVGKVAIWPEGRPGHVYNNNLLRLRFVDAIDPRFAFLQMIAAPFRGYLETVKSATTSVAAIYQRSVMAAPFGVPELPEQREIVRRIEAAFARIDRLADESARAARLLDRLDERLLAKAFRGELVPQDPADEPAAALLARLRETRAAAPKRGRKRSSDAAAD